MRCSGVYLLHHDLIAPGKRPSSPAPRDTTWAGPGVSPVSLQFEQQILRSVSISGEAVIVFADHD